MITLKEIYNIKRKLIEMNNLNELTTMINTDSIRANLNTDNNTIRIESEEGINNITDKLNTTIPIWYGSDDMNPPIHLFYNIFPISNNTCLLKI